MKRLPFLFAGRVALQFVAFVLLAAAMAVSAAVPAAADSTKYAEGIFWKVQRDGGPASHVLGTLHSTDPRLRDLPEQIRQPFMAARDVVFELPQDPQGQARLQQAMALPQGRRLDDILGPDLFGAVAEVAARYGFQPQMLRPLKPWALSTFLIFPQAEMARLAQGEKVLDDWLRSEALRLNKAVHGLESYAEQIAIFDDMTEAEQVAMVSELVADSGQLEATFNAMLNDYLKGQVGAIMAQLNDLEGVSDPEAARRFQQRLFFDRNITMAARMERFLQRGGAFVAIGAGHLPGEAGVLDLLERQGYRITRVY
ncbi:TraB/GumN family protein [Pelagibius sp.]|uniref:TraB/GumN family protein n=1 Tax=Pelagibius sp. TaxID=1931238 RepID=UPI002618ACD2|nr:TraB/GumN family protein [Pelagibius sp.]